MARQAAELCGIGRLVALVHSHFVVVLLGLHAAEEERDVRVPHTTLDRPLALQRKTHAREGVMQQRYGSERTCATEA